jgi:4-amino-4-deoxy-L-arabinose transferase-like glycosyltransferase
MVSVLPRPSAEPQIRAPETVVPRTRPRYAGAWLLLLVLGLTLLALGVRVIGLEAPDGQMDTDETRLALATDGVLQTGLPAMPSGRIYTRGLLNSYLMAPSFALLGRSDFSARLPSALAGALLVPLMFLLGRALGGNLAGLAAASFVVVSQELVGWSRSAWMPSIFLLLFMLSVYGTYRGFVLRDGRWQVAGAAFFFLALLSYEFGVLLLGGLAVFLGSRVLRRDWGWYQGRATLLALTTYLVGLLLFGALILGLRAGTLAGPLGEIEKFVEVTPSLEGLEFYYQNLLSRYTILIVVAAFALPLLARAQSGGTVYLVSLLAAVVLVPSLLLQGKLSERYSLAALPLVALLAAGGIAELLKPLSGRSGSWRGLGALLSLVALLLAFGTALAGDVDLVSRLVRQPPARETWLQALEQQGVGPDDLVLSDAPTVVYFYLGRADYFLYSDDYERYTYRTAGGLRSIYTDSLLVRTRRDFERLVERKQLGRTLWVIGREHQLTRWSGLSDRRLLPSLVDSADQVVKTPDGWMFLKVPLPRRTTEG